MFVEKRLIMCRFSLNVSHLLWSVRGDAKARPTHTAPFLLIYHHYEHMGERDSENIDGHPYVGD